MRTLDKAQRIVHIKKEIRKKKILASNMDKHKYYRLLVLVSSYLTIPALLTYRRSNLLRAS
jgi:hypothetical protein